MNALFKKESLREMINTFTDNSYVEKDFLNQLKDNECTVRIYLVNGICLEGKLVGFDRAILKIESMGRTQAIYKRNVTSIYQKGLQRNEE